MRIWTMMGVLLLLASSQGCGALTAAEVASVAGVASNVMADLQPILAAMDDDIAEITVVASLAADKVKEVATEVAKTQEEVEGIEENAGLSWEDWAKILSATAGTAGGAWLLRNQKYVKGNAAATDPAASA